MKKGFIKHLFYILILLFSCKKENKEHVSLHSSRTFRMGFQNSAPRYDFNTVMQSLHIWEQRADAAIITTEVPWDTLFKGTSPVEYVNNNYKALVEYYRSKNFKLWVYIDPANGLNRRTDSQALINAKKSIAQTEIQTLYRRFVFVMDSILKPEHLGLALETNAIRELSPDSIYQGIKKATTDVSKVIRSYDKNVKLSISVQVDYAWGKLDNSSYKSIETDFLDFPFIDELGLSSYPYFVFENPKDIPLNYYSRLLTNKSIPVFVSEGGWSSATVGKINGTLQKQSDYFSRQSLLLDEVNAIGLFQLTFTDFDMSNFPVETPSDLQLFSTIGLVDIDLKPKPSLSVWDSIFSRKYIGN